jgi:hypothetical protein
MDMSAGNRDWRPEGGDAKTATGSNASAAAMENMKVSLEPSGSTTFLEQSVRIRLKFICHHFVTCING